MAETEGDMLDAFVHVFRRPSGSERRDRARPALRAR
jgi:hypothetical protein